MTADQLAGILKAVVHLLGVLAWPALVLFVLVRLGPAVREFFDNLGEFTLKAAGVELT